MGFHIQTAKTCREAPRFLIEIKRAKFDSFFELWEHFEVRERCNYFLPGFSFRRCRY